MKETGNCGLGPVQFQYQDAETDEVTHERATFEKSLPTEILWTALDRLFVETLPTLTGGE